MRRRGKDPAGDGGGDATAPTLPEHLGRIQGYLRKLGLLARGLRAHG